MRSLRHALPFAFLAAVAFVFFGRYALDGQTLAYDDLAYWFFPWKSLLYRLAHEGSIGFWLPWEFCGLPHIADIQRQIFYPPNLIFYGVPTGPAMVAFVALHFFIASALMYAWLRQTGRPSTLEPSAALCGALIFAFSAFPLLHLTQLPVLASYVWIPGLMLAIERYCRDSAERGRPALDWLIAGVLDYTLMLLGGAPQIVFIASVVGVAWMIFLLIGDEASTPGRKVRFALIGATVPLLALGLAGLQLVPMVELTAFTARQPAVSSAWSSIGTAAPRMLWTLLNPYVFGNPVEGTWSGGYTFHEECFYVGAVTLVLVAAALGDAHRAGLRIGFFLTCALLGLVISLGNNVHVGELGGHDVLRALLPGFGKFRVPPRWMVLTVVGVSVLAGHGVQALCGYRSTRDREAISSAVPLAACFVAFFGLVALVLHARASFGFAFPQARWTLLLLFSTLACAAVGRLRGRRAVAATGLVLLVGVDLLAFAGAYVHAEPSPAASGDLAIVRDLAARPDVGRVVTHTSVDIPTQIATWCAPFGVRNVQGTNPLFLRPYIDYLYYSQAGHGQGPGDPGYMHHNGFFVMLPAESAMTRMLNLTDVLELDVDGAGRDAARYRLSGGRGGLRARRVEGALGLAWAVPGYRVISNPQDIFAVIRAPGFDPRSEVLLEAAPSFPSPPLGGRVNARVTPQRYEADLIALTAELDRAGLLVFSEIFYPGWTCTVDGRSVEVLRANGALRAIPLEAGRHEIVMRFRPRSFLYGLTLTVFTALVMSLMLVIERRRRRGGATS
ncbi:MAG: hypothetical protein EB084_13030 [Proteobacteria bacterium]|nr:hypothetical protein [Pseudomonadota bacterium]